MDALTRLLHLAHAKAKPHAEQQEPLHLEVDQSLLSDRRTFRLICRDGSRVPFDMAGLPYTFGNFQLQVQEKGLIIVGVDLHVEGEPAESAAYLAQYLGTPSMGGGKGAVVDIHLRLGADAVRTHFSKLPRRDDPWRALHVRGPQGQVVVRDLRQYEVVSWRVRPAQEAPQTS